MYLERTCPCATLPTTNPTWPDVRANWADRCYWPIRFGPMQWVPTARAQSGTEVGFETQQCQCPFLTTLPRGVYTLSQSWDARQAGVSYCGCSRSELGSCGESQRHVCIHTCGAYPFSVILLAHRTRDLLRNQQHWLSRIVTSPCL
jgi:hypothetical protein